MTDSRFAISIHILTLLDQAGGTLLSSEYMAGSININPVLVRKELGNLRKHGFVESREGKNGGSKLGKPAAEIKMADVYHAVNPGTLLGTLKNEPNPQCPVGKQINSHLSALYQSAEKALIKQLAKQTLAGFSKQFG